jgi:hypothetical protein
MDKKSLVIGCLLFVSGYLLFVDRAEAKVLLPNASGDYSLWMNDGGGAGTYNKVNEYPNNDGDSGYNTISLNDTKQMYNFADNSDSGTVRGVRVVFYAKVNGINVEYIRPLLKAGSESAGDNCTTINNSSYTQCSHYWSTKPGGGSWSVSDLTNLQAGFETQANGAWNSDEHKVTQLYVDVDFKTETKKTKYHIVQKLVAVNGTSDDPFSFSIADPVDAVQSAFLEIGGVAQPVANVNLDVKVDDNSATPGTYDKTYAINASGRPTNFKVVHDVTDYFKQFVNSAGTYNRYLHLKTDNNIYLLHAKLVITYTYIIPPPVVGAYRAKAELTSSVFDSGVTDGAAYNSILWKGSLGSPNPGKVRIQIATSNTETVTDFKGSDCTSNSWYEIDPNTSTEIKCFSSHNNKRYFKYKIQLCSASNCTDSGNGNPEVTDVIISWSP